MKEYRIGDHGLIHDRMHGKTLHEDMHHKNMHNDMHFNSISNAGKVFDHNHRHGIDK